MACVLSFQAAGGKSTHKLVNQCGARLAYKIKCSNNSNYTVNPVFGIVEIGDQGQIVIERKPGKPKVNTSVNDQPVCLGRQVGCPVPGGSS